MKHFSKLLCCLLFCFVHLFLSAQVRTFSDISKLDFRNSGAIYEDRAVIGYFFYYSFGKAKRGKQNFVLRIVDENLQDVNSETILEYKHTRVVGGFFNGKFICIKLYEDYLEQLTLLFFDKKGTLISKIIRKTDSPGAIYPIEDGFVNYTAFRNSGDYTVEFFRNPGSEGDEFQGMWTYHFKNDKMRQESYADYMCIKDNLLVSITSNKPSKSSNKEYFKILGLDLSSGQNVFETSIDDQYQAQPLAAFYNDQSNQINVVGIYFAPDAKIEKENGLGLFDFSLSMEGDVEEKKYLSWTNEFRQYLTVDNNGIVSTREQNGYLYFHDIIKNPDGSIIAIAEQYRRTIDGVGVAMNILTVAVGGYSSTGMTKMVVGDMVIFRFNPDFSIRSVDFMDKTKTEINLPSGYGVANIHKMSKYIKSIGGFDYLFTSMGTDGGLTSIAFIDHEKPAEGGKKEWVFNTANFYEDKLVRDRIPLGRTRDMNFRVIYPAKPGSILLADYDRSEKTLHVYLEKINY